METPAIARKSLVVIFLIGLILLIGATFAGHSYGSNQATVELEDVKYDWEQLQAKMMETTELIQSAEKQLEHVTTVLEEYEEEESIVKEELTKQKNALNDLKEELADAKAVIKSKDSVAKEIEQLEKEKKEKQAELGEVEEQIHGQRQELELISKRILEKKGQPITLPAGVFHVGKDIPMGRYKIEPAQGFGNYFVNTYETNIILGKGDSLFLPEYILYLKDGDKIEATLSVKYTPIE